MVLGPVELTGVAGDDPAGAAVLRARRDHRVLVVVAGGLRGQEALTVLVGRCQADGSINPTGDAALMARVLVGMLPGYVLQRLLDPDLTPDAFLRGVTDLIGPLVTTR